MLVFSELQDMLRQLPDVIWAAIIASLLTLSGVWLANRNARHQQNSALKHDAYQRDREREMALRRDIYLPAVEAISNEHSLVARMVDLNLSDQEIATETRKDAVAIARILVIGTTATVQAAYALSHALDTALLELMLKRAPLINKDNEINILNNLIDRFSADHKHYMEFEEQLILNSNLDKQALETNNFRTNYLFNQINDCMQKQKQYSIDQYPERIELNNLCLKHLIEISSLIPPAIFAIRDELDIPIDKETFLKLHHQNIEITKQALARFTEQINTQAKLESTEKP